MTELVQDYVTQDSDLDHDAPQEMVGFILFIIFLIGIQTIALASNVGLCCFSAEQAVCYRCFS